jgi:hypothetical protein
MHARPDRRVEPGPAVFRAEDNVQDDLAERLRHIEEIYFIEAPATG